MFQLDPLLAVKLPFEHSGCEVRTRPPLPPGGALASAYLMEAIAKTLVMLTKMRGMIIKMVLMI